jgi:hypothetical protein
MGRDNCCKSVFYLIDGVAINGVGGGPVFAALKNDQPQLLGTISAYMPNRMRGDALPGLHPDCIHSERNSLSRFAISERRV